MSETDDDFNIEMHDSEANKDDSHTEEEKSHELGSDSDVSFQIRKKYLEYLVMFLNGFVLFE